MLSILHPHVFHLENRPRRHVRNLPQFSCSLMKCYSRSPVFMTTHEKSYANVTGWSEVRGMWWYMEDFFLCSPKKMDQLSSFAHVSLQQRHSLQAWCVDRHFLSGFSDPKNSSRIPICIQAFFKSQNSTLFFGLFLVGDLIKQAQNLEKNVHSSTFVENLLPPQHT